MLSIVVPVYKTEKYIRQCIDSILAQEYDDFELILIDDGSPDSSGAVCSPCYRIISQGSRSWCCAGGKGDGLYKLADYNQGSDT